MSTRFGGVSSKNKQQQQLKMFMAGCAVLCFVLLGVLFVLIQAPAPTEQIQPAVAVTPVEAVQQPTADSVTILLTRQRIEEGVLVTPDLFKEEPWDANNVPPGAILKGKLEASQKQYYTAHLIGPNVPLLETSLTEIKPISAIDIPPGHRAVTITVDNRSGVEGWAKPNSRVDILWTHSGKDNRKRVTTLVPYALVLSVGGVAANAGGGQAQVSQGTTVTLLVTTQQAKKVELARTLGDLSLSLYGGVETAGEADGGGTITEADILGESNVEGKDELPVDGVMYETDPVTGKKKKYVLIDGRWKLDAEE